MFEQLFADYGALVGVAALITFLVSLGKQFGFIPDGDAAKWNLVGNVAGFAFFAILGVVDPDFDFSNADAIAANLVELGNIIFVLLAQLGITRGLYAGVRGVPLVGFSHSG